MKCQFCNSIMDINHNLTNSDGKCYKCINCKILQLSEQSFNDDVIIIPSKNFQLYDVNYPLPTPNPYRTFYNIVCNSFFDMLNFFPKYNLNIIKYNLNDFGFELCEFYCKDNLIYNKVLPTYNIADITPFNFDKKLKTILTFM